MGIFLQLLVLLWKNWSIKKRHMWVTAFELATPLVLFLILMGLRMNEPIEKRGGTNFRPRPLPSSGMVAVLQEFCPHQDGTDVYGYPVHKHAMIEPFLVHIHRAWENSGTVADGFNVSDTLRHFNETWENMTMDSRNLDALFNESHSDKKVHLRDILKNATEFQKYLMTNLSISRQDASSVLDSTVDFKNILKNLQYPSTAAPSNEYSIRNKRSIPSIGSSFFPISELKDNIFRDKNRKKIKNLNDNIAYSTEPIDPSLLPLVNVALYGFPGILSSNLSKSERHIQEEKLRGIETVLLSPTSLYYILCDSKHSVLKSSVSLNATNLNSTKSRLCNHTNEATFKSLSVELLSQLNNSAILNDLTSSSGTQNALISQNYEKNLRSVLKDLEEIEKYSAYIDSLVRISQIIPANTCAIYEPDPSALNQTDLRNTSTTLHDNSTTFGHFVTHEQAEGKQSDPAKSKTKSRSHSKPDYLALWSSIQPLLCGPDKNDGGESWSSSNRSSFHLTNGQKRNLGMLIHVLMSNPKILYAPNNTQVERIIRNANTSFAIIDNITKAGDTWRNVSKNIRRSLEDPQVETTLELLAKMKREYKKHPKLMKNLTAGQPELQKFLSSNQSLPNKTVLLSQLDQIDNAACGWKYFVSGISIDWFMGFSTENEAVQYATEDAYHNNASVFATLIFEVDSKGNIPPHIRYKIRQNASFTLDTASIRLSYWRPDPYGWNFRYYTFGFVWIQDLIERALIWDYIDRDVVSPGAYVHTMPFPCFRFDAFAMNLEHFMPLAMILSWVYTVAMFVQHIVYEKEQRLKEVMKIMGLSNGVHWLAWFISIFVQLEITVTVISVLVKYGRTAILPNSDFMIIWLFFSVYAAATIMFCFLVSVLFSKAKVASACSGIIYFITYLPFAYMSIQEYILHQSIPAVIKSAASLLSTTAFGLGAKYFALYELSGYGIQWDNIGQTPVEGDTFSLLQALNMLIVDIFVYAFLTWYIEAVFPGQYGLPRPWYFPLTISYWMGHGGTERETCTPRKLWLYLTQPGYRSLTEEDQAAVMETQNDAEIEPEPTHLALGVSIQRLTKIYKRGGKKAVNKLSLNFYENQITSFLGHNGAGKTTTMSILTGLFPPTSGTAYVYGCDIRNDMLNIRKSLGMCPQHNALFDVLTVEEHLWFYARLKGVPSQQILKEMDQFLTDVGLHNKRHSKVNTLSGGMKRKLSVAIAFVGGSRTVILDEPTAGVDPYARRAIWDLIIKYKEGRTILLSTHHMDEADLLGDRIAIISNGKLQCCGSSLFLKSTYGDGYNLTLLKKKNCKTPDEASTASSSNQSDETEGNLNKFIHKHVPNALLTTSSPNQVSFNLPLESARKGCFYRLFDDLPPKMDDLKVSGYGLSDTTLEEVFLKVDTANRWDSEESSHIDNKKKMKVFASSSVTVPVGCEESPRSHPDASSAPSCSYNSDQGYGGSAESGEPSSVNNETSLSNKADGDDAGNALDWLSNAPDVADVSEHYHLEKTTTAEEEEALLLDYSFGDSSFCLTTDETTATSHGSSASGGDPFRAHRHLDDVELINLEEDLEGRASYKLSSAMRNWRILQGLLVKRLHYARRSRKAVFYQIMLPALFVCIAMTVALSLPIAGDPPALVLSPSQYHNMTQPRGNFIPFSDQSVLFPVPPTPSSSSSKIVDAGAAALINTFSLPSGVGATCVLKNGSEFNVDLNMTTSSSASGNHQLVMTYFNPGCQASFTRGIPLSQFVPPVAPKVDVNSTSTMHLDKGAPCACAPDGNTYICQVGYGEFPVTRTVVTGDKLIDITGEEPIMPYLKYTTNDYRLHRYGAFSFGEVRKSVKQTFPGWPSPLRKIAVRDAAQVFFNHKGFHSMPTYLNVFNNALLRANLPKSKGNPAAYGITVINHPMNKTAGALSLDFLVSGTDVIIAIFIIVAMSFVPASFLVFLVAEKQSRAKHLQFISGTGPVTYWLANYIWDMLNYLFPAALCIMILQIFDLPAYTRGQNAYAVVALFLLYGWSMTPMMYPASFYFSVPSTAYVALIVINLFVGITTVVTTFMISLFNDDEYLVALNKKLETAFLVFPNYNLGKGLMDLTYYEYMNDYYTKIGQVGKVRHPFEWDVITRSLVAMGIEGMVGFLITLLFEVRFFTRFSSKKVSLHNSRGATDSEDVDVRNERHRVERLRYQNRPEDLIIVDHLTKVYKKKQGETVAVDGLSFSVAPGECFGLLGVNGAGKTTTFHTITGAREVTSGNIVVSGHQMSAGKSFERLAAQQSTGYCPQFDALFNELTPVEHLHLYARLRGIPHKDEARVVDWAIVKLDLVRHKNTPARDLSGGNKRKLSVAIALVGYPSVILLDEPTSGMDPGARRFLWDLILDVTRSGRAVLLTSHSMEECEALCSRIGIMVNGKFECLGPTQHLKNRFGDGYMVSIRSTEPSRFVEVFQEAFPLAVLKEQHYHKAVFQLPCLQNGDTGSLAKVFKLLEDRRDELKIEDYSVSQTTLDDVFINFAKKQRSETSTSKSLASVWKERIFSLRNRLISSHEPSPSSTDLSGSTNSSRSNLYMRGSPNLPDTSDSSQPLDDDLDDDQPLYNFTQDMSLSFIDSSC